MKTNFIYRCFNKRYWPIILLVTPTLVAIESAEATQEPLSTTQARSLTEPGNRPVTSPPDISVTDPTKWYTFHAPTDNPHWRTDSEHLAALYKQNSDIVKRGDKLVDQGDLDGAIAVYKEALDFKPVTYAARQAHIGLADVFAKKGRYADALAQYNLAKSKDSPSEPFLNHDFFGGNSGVQLKYVIALCRVGKFDEARSAYRQALLDAPTLLNGTDYVPLDISVTDINYTTRQLETAARLALGIYYGADGVRAAAQFEEAIKLRPKFAASYFYLAMALRDSYLIPKSVEVRAPTTLNFTSALEKAASLGDDFIRVRAEQESGKRPRMTAMEARAISERQKSRLAGMLEEVQEGRR